MLLILATKSISESRVNRHFSWGQYPDISALTTKNSATSNSSWGKHFFQRQLCAAIITRNHIANGSECKDQVFSAYKRNVSKQVEDDGKKDSDNYLCRTISECLSDVLVDGCVYMVL